MFEFILVDEPIFVFIVLSEGIFEVVVFLSRIRRGITWLEHITNLINNMIKKDLFGFVTQGAHYEQFRPKYPLTLIGECLKNLPKKDNFLDVATGTGQLLFPLAADFKERRIGTDISDKMIFLWMVGST